MSLKTDKAYIVSGSLFGDCGKGSVCDYLASVSDAKYTVRHNGGSQASHTVSVLGTTHKFSQLGSAFLNPKTKTYLSRNTIVNPFNIVSEARVLENESKFKLEDITRRIILDEEAKVVTPYHGLINKIRELSNGGYRGTTGSGVSEVPIIYDETGIVLTVRDLKLMDELTKEKLRELFKYTRYFYETHKFSISQDLLKSLIDEKDIFNLTDLSNEDYIITCYENLFRSNLIRTSPSFESVYEGGSIIFEGSQGVLLDKDYGIKPNTTMLDTTNRYALEMCEHLELESIKINATSVIASRHGKGILPTYDKGLSSEIFDENQVETYYQGRPVYGWLDLVLLRYSIKCNPCDYTFLTLVDILKGKKTIKVCNSYLYKGIITKEFEELFEYYVNDGKVIITNINKPQDNLKSYLDKCEPIYEELKGYEDENSYELLEVINYIEKNLNTSISHISYGKDRSMKRRLMKI